MPIKVTVLMSVYNAEKYLKEAIESIFEQTYKNFEFLIINDGSTDRSEAIILSYKDQRIKYIKNENNIGLTRSLNIGINKARGKYIARMDADDISLPDRLEIQYHFMEQNPEYGLISSCIGLIDEKKKVREEWCSHLTSEDIFYLLHFRNCIAHSSVMFRKEIILEAGGYNEKIPVAQDYELWERLSKLTRCYEDWRILLLWRNSEDNLSGRNLIRQRDVVKKVSYDGIKKIIGNKINDEDIIFIQNFKFFKIKDIYSLKKVLSILDEINVCILSGESIIIKKLNFDLKNLKRAMNKKSVDLIYTFFRSRPFHLNVKNFLHLSFNKKRKLVEEVLKRLKKKTGFLFNKE